MYKIESPQDGGTPPGPNFGLIVGLAVVAMFVILGIAVLVVPNFGHLIHAVKRNPHPTSQVLPMRPGRDV